MLCVFVKLKPPKFLMKPETFDVSINDVESKVGFLTVLKQLVEYSGHIIGASEVQEKMKQILSNFALKSLKGKA